METKMLEERLKFLEIKVMKIEENQVRNASIMLNMSALCLNLQAKIGDKSPRSGQNVPKAQNLGTLCPRWRSTGLNRGSGL